MTVNLSMLAGAGAQFFDNNGVILSGGLVYTYAAGTTTPQTTYTTSAGSTAHTNPIVLDSAGRVASGGEIWLTDSVEYKFVTRTSTAVLIGTYDNITGNASGIYANFAASSGSALVGYLPSNVNAIPTTVQAKLRESVSVFDFMTAAQIADVTSRTASIDCTAAFNAAINSISNNSNTTFVTTGGTIRVPAGTYLITGTIQMNSNTTLEGEGTYASVLFYTGSGICLKMGSGITGTGANFFKYYVNIRELCVKGTAAATDGIFVYGCVRYEIKNVLTIGFSQAATLSYTTVMYDGSAGTTITTSGASGIHLFDFAFLAKIDHVRSQDNYYGLKASTATVGFGNAFSATEVTGQCEFQDNQYGIVLGADNRARVGGIVGTGASINNCTIENNVLGGVWVCEGRSINLYSNYLEANNGFELRMGDPVNTTIAVECNIRDNLFNIDSAGTAIDGVRMLQCTINGNNFENGTTAISLSFACQYVRVFDNRLNGGCVNVNAFGTGTIIADQFNRFTAPTLLNSWTNVGGASAPAGYFLDLTGTVHLKGVVTGGLVNTVIFTLPAGYTPRTGNQYFPVVNNATNINTIRIEPIGDVYATTLTGASIGLDGITFSAVPI